MINAADTKKEDIATMSIAERQELQKQVARSLGRILRQKLVFAILLLSGIKLFLIEYLADGLSLITVLPILIVLLTVSLFRTAYRYERVLKEVKEALIAIEQGETLY